MQDDLLQKSESTEPVKPAEESETSQLLSQLTIFSTIFFVCSSLLVRFLINLQTAILLKIYSIHFQYRLFDIQFSSVDGTKWSVDRILVVFGLGYLLFSIIGIRLVYYLRNIQNINWKNRLFLTWMAFLLTYTLPAGIIAGVLFYNCFGIAFHWLSGNIIIRILIGVAVFVMMIFFRPLWLFLFLKASPSILFFGDEKHLKLYSQNVFFNSWFLGFLILLVFNKPLFDGFWPVFLLSLGFIALPFLNQPVVYDNLYIRKSEKKVFLSRSAVFYILVLLTLIWVAGTLTINF